MSGISWPVFRFSLGCCVRICMPSSTFLCRGLGSLSMTFTVSMRGLRFGTWPTCSWCWLSADELSLELIDFVCSVILCPNDRPVSQMYLSPHPSHSAPEQWNILFEPLSFSAQACAALAAFALNFINPD